jgi:hypothetical protein
MVSETVKMSRTEILEWTNKINDSANGSKRSVFETGDLLKVLKAKSEDGYKLAVGGSVLITEKTASNYIRAANKGYLREKHIYDNLPLGVGHNIDLAAPKWTPADIDKAIEKGVIHPLATRREIREWYDNYGSESVPDEPPDEPPKPKDNDDDTTTNPKPKDNDDDGGQPNPKDNDGDSAKPDWGNLFTIQGDLSQLDPDKHNKIGMELEQGLPPWLQIKRHDPWKGRKSANDNTDTNRAA